MIYVMSDLHGCYELFKKALKKINFSQNDTLYILGDILDRGKEPIRLVQKILSYNNIVCLEGNHEQMAFPILKYIHKNFNGYCTSSTPEILMTKELWRQNGGGITLNQFCKLNKSKRKEILNFLKKLVPYVEIKVNNRNFVMVHGGLADFNENKKLSDYDSQNMPWIRTDYSKVYYKNKILVTGHTPTLNFTNKAAVYFEKNHLGIDCGCVFTGVLGVVRLNDMKDFYVLNDSQSTVTERNKYENISGTIR